MTTQPVIVPASAEINEVRLIDVTEREVVLVVGGERKALTWSILRSCVSADNAPDIRSLYETVLSSARPRLTALVERKLTGRIAECASHKAIKSVDRPFVGPVVRDQNRAAHGGVCVVETCRCGARRATNVNGSHQEEGAWHLDPADVTYAERQIVEG